MKQEEQVTTVEWIEENAKDLAYEIYTHIRVIADKLTKDETSDLLRLTMMSILQWSEEREKEGSNHE